MYRVREGDVTTEQWSGDVRKQQPAREAAGF